MLIAHCSFKRDCRIVQIIVKNPKFHLNQTNRFKEPFIPTGKHSFWWGLSVVHKMGLLITYLKMREQMDDPYKLRPLEGVDEAVISGRQQPLTPGDADGRQGGLVDDRRHRPLVELVHPPQLPLVQDWLEVGLVQGDRTLELSDQADHGASIAVGELTVGAVTVALVAFCV